MRLDRRSLIRGAAALISTPTIGRAQALQPVRLLVIRQMARVPSSNCVAPCIRGQVINASGIGDMATLDLITAKTLPIVCDVIERPWKNNAANVSAVPAGIYDAFVRDNIGINPDGSEKKWMHTSYDHRWRIQLDRTEPRTAIQLHHGKDVSWSAGCLIVGQHVDQHAAGGIGPDYCLLEDPVSAIKALRAIVQGPGSNPDDIKVAITDEAGLYPDFETTAC